MKRIFLIGAFFLLFLNGCKEIYTEFEKINIEESERIKIESEIYSLKEYKDIFSSFCSSKTVIANSKVIGKDECNCPDDPAVICDCYIFGGGTLTLGDDKGIIESYVYYSVADIWEEIEEGKEYLFTFDLYPKSVSLTNKVGHFDGEMPSLRKAVEEYRKEYNQFCEEKTFKIKAKVVEKIACFPPYFEGIVFRCDIEDRLVIESGGLMEEFTQINKDVLKRANEGQEYIFTLRKNSIIDVA